MQGNRVLHGRPLQTGGGGGGTDFSAPQHQQPAYHQAPPTPAYAQQPHMGSTDMDFQPSMSHSIPLPPDVSQQSYGADAHGTIGMGHMEPSMHQRSAVTNSHGQATSGVGGNLYQNIANIAVRSGTQSENAQAVRFISGKGCKHFFSSPFVQPGCVFVSYISFGEQERISLESLFVFLHWP